MAETRPYPGFLIAFEGPEGAGRREALAHARGALQARGQDVVVSRPMGATLAGGIYRSAAPLNELSPRTLVLVAASDMAERLEWEILPALHAGKIVLVDRYVYRTVQGMARDLDPDWLEVLCAVAPRPDLVFLFHDEETVKRSRLDLATIDLYEAGMDLGPDPRRPVQLPALPAARPGGVRGLGRVAPDRPAPAAHDGRDGGPDRGAGRHRGRRPERAPPGRPQHAAPALPRSAARDADGDAGAAAVRSASAAARAAAPQAAELFEFGVLLHNVGEHGEERDRHVRTAALIRESNLPGFTPDELNVIGVLAAAHTIHHQRELEAWLATVPSASPADGREAGAAGAAGGRHGRHRTSRPCAGSRRSWPRRASC